MVQIKDDTARINLHGQVDYEVELEIERQKFRQETFLTSRLFGENKKLLDEVGRLRYALKACEDAMNDYLNGEHYNKITGKVDTYFSVPLALAENALDTESAQSGEKQKACTCCTELGGCKDADDACSGCRHCLACT